MISVFRSLSITSLFCICLQICLFFYLPGRTVAQSIGNIDWKVSGTGVVIQYDLEDCRSDELFNVSVYFETMEGEKIFPVTIYGNLKEVPCGREKTIFWNNGRDKAVLDGYYKVVVNAEKVARKKSRAALASIFIPGLGDQMLEKSSKKRQRIRPWMITLSALGSIGAGIATRFGADNLYEGYLKNGTESELSNYNLANNLHKASMMLFTVGGTIWLADVIHVAKKAKHIRP